MTRNSSVLAGTVRFGYRLLRLSTSRVKSLFFSPRPTAGSGRIVFGSSGVGLRFSRSPTANFVLNGNLYLTSDLGDRGEAKISLGPNSSLEIHGDFTIGAGVSISVSENARLSIGGKRNSSGSGITCNTRIMVHRSATIGFDSIIAWDCFITDCDWHQIIGLPHTGNLAIGNNVWIARGATVLKGTEIGDGSIVGAGSVVAGGKFPSQSLIVGNPAKVIRSNVKWNRDMELNQDIALPDVVRSTL